MTEPRPAPGHRRGDCPGLPTGFNLQEYTSTRMTNWFAPGVLLATGIRDLLSKIFAAYADRRASIAALREVQAYTELANKKSVWLDYLADTGDGWNSCYSVAWCLGQTSQAIEAGGGKRDLARGDLLVMGGDQVYPYATTDDYNRKLVRPFQAALPCTPKNRHPALFAIPGNHDWYDGLRGFLRRFCQDDWLGGWRTHQTRPYWAVQLPYRWWLFGVDTQMDDYIDQAQLDFFKEVKLKKGDRVILCVAAPSWVYAANGEQRLNRNLAFFENEIIVSKKARLALTLSGDLHHYSHYVNSDGSRHKITCGGGGAFTHGTHHLPETIDLVEAGTEQRYTISENLLPDRRQSKKLLRWNLLFPLRHLRFAKVLGGFYLVYAWVLAAAGLPQQLATVPLQVDNTLQVLGLYVTTTFTQAWPFLFFMLLVASGNVFASPDWHGNPTKKNIRKLVGGTIHALLHLLILVPLLWGLAHCPDIKLPPFVPDWASAIRFGVSVFVTGGLVGGLLFGLYLIASNIWFGFHRTEAFSAVRDRDHKSFLRMQLDKDGLTVYPLGLQTVERNWEVDENGGENRSWIKPVGEKPLKPTLIGEPIRIR